MRFCKYIVAFVILISLAALPLFASERFWEYPARFTESDSRFPSVVSGSAGSKD